MEELVMELARTAFNERAVASRTLDNGMDLLVYPLDDGMIVGFGLPADMAEELEHEELLRRRSDDLARFGPWQPVLLRDGSCYVMRRLPGADPYSSIPVLSSDELFAAEELLR